MRKALVPALIMLSVVPLASASVMLYEPFNYTPGTALTGQSPDAGVHTWARAGTSTSVDDNLAIGGNLNVPIPMSFPTGNSTNYGGKGYTERINIGSAINTGSIYYSFAITINNMGNVTNQIVAGLNNTVGTGTTNPTVIGADLWARPGTTAGTFNLGVSLSAATASRSYGATPTDYPLGTTVFVVGAYDFVAGSANDTARMWLYNPSTDTLPTLEPAVTAQSVAGAADAAASLATFLFYQTGTTATNTLGEGAIIADELRIGTAWTDVAPEPASLSFLGIGALLLSRRRR